MYTPDMKPAMLPYYSSYEVQEATPQQIDQLSNTFANISDLVNTVEIFVLALGIASIVAAIIIMYCSYKMQGRDKPDTKAIDNKSELQLSQL